DLRDLVVARALHAAGDAPDARAGVVRPADLGVLLRAHAQDGDDVAEGLDVVDDRLAIVEAEHGREKRRLDARVRALALERLDQTGLLAADVGRGAAVDHDVAAVSTAQYIVARVALLLRLEDRLVEQLRGQRHLLADVDEGL